MDTQMVAPSELHRALEKAADAGVDERRQTLAQVLASGNLAVIRRIPELLMPFQSDEINTVYDWAAEMTSRQDIDVSDKDFAFHLLVNCGVPADMIMNLLERQGTYSQSTLSHIEQALQGDRSNFDKYLRQVADGLIKEERIPSRDRARHIYMTIAKSPEDWRALAQRIAVTEFTDLRQRVLERFLRDCIDNEALVVFCDNVIDGCWPLIQNAEDAHKVASRMHWVLACAERMQWKEDLKEAAELFNEFGRALPNSVRDRIRHLVPMHHNRVLRKGTPGGGVRR